MSETANVSLPLFLIAAALLSKSANERLSRKKWRREEREAERTFRPPSLVLVLTNSRSDRDFGEDGRFEVALQKILPLSDTTEVLNLSRPFLLPKECGRPRIRVYAFSIETSWHGHYSSSFHSEMSPNGVTTAASEP